MFPIDAFTNKKATDTKWLVVLRAIIAILLTAGLLVDIGFQISDIVAGATFFQASEVLPSQDPYVYYLPNIDVGYDDSINVSIIPSRNSNGTIIDQALPPTGSIYLSCLLEYSNSSLPNEDCSEWIKNYPTWLGVQSFRSSKKIPYLDGSVTFYLYLPASHNYTNNGLAGISFLLWDPDFDPVVSMDPADVGYFNSSGTVQDVTQFNNLYALDLSLGYASYTVNFHKVITKRSLTGRNGWNTFLNYIGISAPDKAMLLNINSVTQTGTGNTVAVNFAISTIANAKQVTITVQDEVRIHTVATLLSNVGGLYSLLVLIYVTLFGKFPDSPWGIIQRINFNFNGYSAKKEVENKIDDNFGTPSGVPLVDEAEWPKSEDLSTRVDDIASRQIALENILNEFFVDAEYLKNLRHRSGKGKSSLSSNI